MSRYFIDTEFIEGFDKPLFGKSRHFIDLISIGIVCSDGREYYAISNEYKYKDASDWVKENVIHPLYKSTVSGFGKDHCHVANFQHAYGKSNKQIARDISHFTNGVYTTNGLAKDYAIEFYGYYADYDWVLFCSLFGRMIDLPNGFPMYCKDLKQTLDEKADKYVNDNLIAPIVSSDWHKDYCINELKMHPDYPKQENEHNALADARWNQKLFKFLDTF